MASQTTPTEGQKLGFFEQMISNLGRFNNNSSGTSNSHTHGNHGPRHRVPGKVSPVLSILHLGD